MWSVDGDEGKVCSPKILNRAAKIVIAKSLEKRRHSIRKITKTVYRHLIQNIGAGAFKRPKIRELLRESRLTDFYSLVIIRIGPLRIGGRFFDQMNLDLNYFQHQTDRRFEYGVRMTKISPQFSKSNFLL